jgi:hypothetical protein
MPAQSGFVSWWPRPLAGDVRRNPQKSQQARLASETFISLGLVAFSRINA